MMDCSLSAIYTIYFRLQYSREVISVPGLDRQRHKKKPLKPHQNIIYSYMQYQYRYTHHVRRQKHKQYLAKSQISTIKAWTRKERCLA
jgi:hypothetical protein